MGGAHLAPLSGDWSLWRDFALRGAGFPVSGLDIFGGDDESERLREVAADPTFREAVTWQNPAALVNALDKLGDHATTKPSKYRQREELVASYWQRYCAKNDTIGFFGPLGWGAVVDDGPALAQRPGALTTERVVHFEHWPIQALADLIDPELRVPLGPFPERDLRTLLADHPRRKEGEALLDRLEYARAVVAAAPREDLLDALVALDAEFTAITSREATRRGGQAYASRTLVYLDCMRGLELAVGPDLVTELAESLRPLLAGMRWYCGAALAAGLRILDDLRANHSDGPLDPLLGELMPRLLREPPEIAAVVAELQQRWASLLEDPDPTTLGARAEALFADAGPAWPLAVYQSIDVQIAATSAEAVAAGDYLVVCGDAHPGANPHSQGLFATRHPDRERFLAAYTQDVGRPLLLVGPRRPQGVSPRIMPAITLPDDPHVFPDELPPPLGVRGYRYTDMLLEGEDVVSRDGTFRVTLREFVQFPIFISCVREYDPFPAEAHSERLRIGRTVLRRETWNPRVADVPDAPAELVAWAQEQGLPRRAFFKSPLEDKPMFVDFASPVLLRIMGRLLRRAAAERPDATLMISEMLPGPDQCWLEDADGNRYTSELRLVAVDSTRAASSRSAGEDADEADVLLVLGGELDRAGAEGD